MTVWMPMTWHCSNPVTPYIIQYAMQTSVSSKYCVYAPLAAECSLLELTWASKPAKTHKRTHKVCTKFSKQLYWGHLYENSCHKFACTYGKDNRQDNPTKTHMCTQILTFVCDGEQRGGNRSLHLVQGPRLGGPAPRVRCMLLPFAGLLIGGHHLRKVTEENRKRWEVSGQGWCYTFRG